MQYPSLAWVKHEVFENAYSRINRRYWQVKEAWIVGSEARGTARPDSDLDIAVVIGRRDGKETRISSLDITERYHLMFRSNRNMPHYEGRRVDFQFFFQGDSELEGYARKAVS